MTALSVITATYNASRHLPRLIESLRAQTDRQFEWVICDGLSTDGTAEMIKGASDIVTDWRSEPDCGIYDALNKALRMASGEYYLVLGADDRIEPGTIQNYRNAVETSGADIVTARVKVNGRVASPRPHSLHWLYAHHAYVSEHAVGSLIRRSLHNKFGDYARSYPIGADALFLKVVCAQPDTRVYCAEFLAGEYGYSGASRKDRAGAICDYFRAQLATERYKFLQVLLFVAKVLWNAPSIVRSARLG